MSTTRIKTTDLKVGMFVVKVHGSWLHSPLFRENFRIGSQKDIDRIVDYGVDYVSVSLENGAPAAGPAAKRTNGLSTADAFETQVTCFWTNSKIPVDIYRENGDGLDLVLGKGSSFSVEIMDLLFGRGIDTVWVPNSQKENYEQYRIRHREREENARSKGYADGFLDPEAVSRHLQFKVEYHPISAYSLVPGSAVSFDVFIRGRGGARLAIRKGNAIDIDLRDKWIDEYTHPLIRKDDRGEYYAYMMRYTRAARDTKTKAAFVRENSKLIVESLSENPRSEKLVMQTRGAVTGLTRVVLDNPTTFYGLAKINERDYYTFTHSVNVATLSLALAMSDGMKDERELAELGLGAILHDLGKARLDGSLINKPGKYTASEYEKMKTHVNVGLGMLRGNSAVTERAKIPLRQHHEKMNGAGYPNGLERGEIDYLGRVTALIDIYDALTTERVYRKAFKPFEALRLIAQGSGDYDNELVTMMVRMLGEQSMPAEE